MSVRSSQSCLSGTVFPSDQVWPALKPAGLSMDAGETLTGHGFTGPPPLKPSLQA